MLANLYAAQNPLPIGRSVVFRVANRACTRHRATISVLDAVMRIKKTDSRETLSEFVGNDAATMVRNTASKRNTVTEKLARSPDVIGSTNENVFRMDKRMTGTIMLMM
ncbi:hypothetical protein DPMN_167150 [Dreissena polymorpha]|uniref:Uncharacterized protein n=1 Tax=Dreissena polymorpha TaxID=45954 RepID=A0A9D4F0B2_DREPO|nr:hypothetical protein DPMN_167150 [Dreissena polymorpha]